MAPYNSLQLREIFHIEFLRSLARAMKGENYALKGGANLRFFFKSFRYSEDMDLDASGVGVAALKDIVMKILDDGAFRDNLKPFGIERVVPSNIVKAKQTGTTQRFKIHLITSSAEDLFTKIEFSRRGFSGDIKVETIDGAILRTYKIAPLLAPHYGAESAVEQKLRALSGRTTVQARDIFDLYILDSQAGAPVRRPDGMDGKTLDKAAERVFEVGFDQFKDTVVAYLDGEDQAAYNNAAVWDDIRLKTSQFIEKARKYHA
ncbi:MAG: nucleotidyl transferase AbiEii/AbiGii toxin family protein [Candidatus Omnitrophota bacterium]